MEEFIGLFITHILPPVLTGIFGYLKIPRKVKRLMGNIEEELETSQKIVGSIKDGKIDKNEAGRISNQIGDAIYWIDKKITGKNKKKNKATSS